MGTRDFYEGMGGVNFWEESLSRFFRAWPTQLGPFDHYIPFIFATEPTPDGLMLWPIRLTRRLEVSP